MTYTERKQLAAEIAQRCAKQGYADGNPETPACIKQEVSREVAMRRNSEAARMAIGEGLSGVGAGMQQSAASYNTYRTVNCRSTPTSTWVGGPVSQVNTTCY